VFFFFFFFINTEPKEGLWVGGGGETGHR